MLQMNLMSLCSENILQMVACSPTMQDNTTNAMTTIASLVQQFPTVFDEQIGQLPGELHLDVDLSVQPVQLPVRRIPLAVKEELVAELKRLKSCKSLKEIMSCPTGNPHCW